MERNKDMEYLHRVMAYDMLDNSIKICFMVKAFTNIQVAINMMVNGKTINGMETVPLHIEMEGNMLVKCIWQETRP